MRLSWRTPALAPVLLLIPALAFAAWHPGGNRIGVAGDHGFAAAVSGPDRVVVSWIRPTPSDQSEVRAQALTADGYLAVGWPTDGVRMGDMAGFGLEPVVAGDGSGGAYVAWVARSNNNDSTLRLQHVSAGGVVAAGWPAEGMLLGTARLIAPALAADNAGGVIVGRAESNPASYEPRAVIQRFDASGALAPGWPAEGVVIPNASQLGVLVDTDGHIFVSTSEIGRASCRERVLPTV